MYDRFKDEKPLADEMSLSLFEAGNGNSPCNESLKRMSFTVIKGELGK